MRPIDVMNQYVTAMRAGDRETASGFFAGDLIVEIRIFEANQYEVDEFQGP